VCSLPGAADLRELDAHATLAATTTTLLS